MRYASDARGAAAGAARARAARSSARLTARCFVPEVTLRPLSFKRRATNSARNSMGTFSIPVEMLREQRGGHVGANVVLAQG